MVEFYRSLPQLSYILQMVEFYRTLPCPTAKAQPTLKAQRRWNSRNKV